VCRPTRPPTAFGAVYPAKARSQTEGTIAA
jgi:hypothetical protein